MAIRRADSRFRRWSFFLPVVFLVQQAALGRGRYTAQVRGTVTDPAHAVVNNAKVTVTNESTSIATTATTNARGEYVVNGLRPASYTVKVEAPGFRNVVRTRLVLAVSQQATVDFALSLASTKVKKIALGMMPKLWRVLPQQRFERRRGISFEGVAARTPPRQPVRRPALRRGPQTLSHSTRPSDLT